MALLGNMKTASGRGETGETTNHTARVYKMARRSVTKSREKENCAELVEKRAISRNAKCLLDGLLKRNGRQRNDLECAFVVWITTI